MEPEGTSALWITVSRDWCLSYAALICADVLTDSWCGCGLLFSLLLNWKMTNCVYVFFFFNQTSFSKSQHLHVVLVICVSLWNTWQQWSSSSQPRAALLLHPLHECVYLKVEIILSRDEMVWNPQFGLSESPGVSNDARMSSCVCESPIRLLLSARTLLNNSFETFWICQE